MVELIGSEFNGYQLVNKFSCRNGFDYKGIKDEDSVFIRLFEGKEQFLPFIRRIEAGVYETLKGLDPNPNLAKVNDYGEKKGLGYLILDFIDGVPLKSISNPDIYNNIDLVCNLGNGISNLHENNLIHGDIWDPNVMIRDNNPCLFDYEHTVLVNPYDLNQRDNNQYAEVIDLGVNRVHSAPWVNELFLDGSINSDLYSLSSLLHKLVFGDYYRPNSFSPSEILGDNYICLNKFFARGFSSGDDKFSCVTEFKNELLKVKNELLTYDNMDLLEVEKRKLKYSLQSVFNDNMDDLGMNDLNKLLSQAEVTGNSSDDVKEEESEFVIHPKDNFGQVFNNLKYVKDEIKGFEDVNDRMVKDGVLYLKPLD